MKTMNAYRYITVLLFSLLIIFAGAGMAVIHCYCVSCQVTHECCDAEHSHHQDHSDEKECCVSNVYKIDLLKGAENITVMAPLVVQLCKQVAHLLDPLAVVMLQPFFDDYHLTPPESRQYLALYSVFII